MLTHQGACSLELWTGRPAPLEQMRAAARAVGLTRLKRPVGAPMHTQGPERGAGVSAPAPPAPRRIQWNVSPSHLRPVPPGGADAATAPALDESRGTPGITPPTQRRSSGRFLTDVLVEMGFVASRRRVDQAIENARETGQTPEHVLLGGRRSSPRTSWRVRWPSATGSTTSISTSSRSTWAPPT